MERSRPPCQTRKTSWESASTIHKKHVHEKTNPNHKKEYQQTKFRGESIVTTLDLNEFVEEFTVFLRNQNVFSVAERGATTQTDEFNGDAAEVDFQINRTNVKNVRSVTVDAASQTFGTNYLVNYNDSNDKTTITFTSAPASGTDNVDIQYDYVDDDIVKPDFDMTDIKLGDFPLMSWDFISESSREGQIGGGKNIVDRGISVTVYETSKRSLRTRLKSIKDAVLSNQKSFFYIKYLTYIGMGPQLLPPFEKTKNKIFQRNLDFLNPIEEESA